MEEAHESVNKAYLRIVKESIMDKMSERNKGSKKDWIVKCLRDEHWFIDKKDASKVIL